MRYTFKFKPVRHSIMFFVALAILFSLFVLLVPRKTQGAVAPTFCIYDRTAGDNLSCIGSRPTYCVSDNTTGDIFSCAGVKPNYCLSESALSGVLSRLELNVMYILDVLKTGKYPTPQSFKKFFSSDNLNDVVTFQRLKETVGTF